MSEETIHSCQYCGARNKSVSMHSGIYECNKCWNWRKLDAPAARHWFKASAMFASNVDFYDRQTFMPERCGVTPEEFSAAIEVAHKIYNATRAMLVERYTDNEAALDGVVRDTYRGMTEVQYLGRDESGNRKNQESL